MPAMLDDPDSQPISRTSGDYPYSSMPLTEIYPRQVTLRDRITIATLVPLSSADQLPSSLVAYLCDQLNREIEKGDTYPFVEPMTVEKFGLYWFATFGAVMLLGSIDRVEDVQDGKDWSKECLGSFYIKPNYPGRSSHVCNGGFLVTDASRNRGVGRLMGEGYLEWAPMLGYTYSVFNLVYETNVASCRIWDALGFKRIGRVKGCGNLKSYPDQLIDAIIYGRDLGPEGEDFVSEERFDKIKFYLKHGKYPNGADRAEKSRLRSAATHYKLLEGDKLMLKDKEVISDPQRQYEIARSVHVQQHGGINKTTATIAEKYHWVRIKETVSLVIRNCEDCKEMAKAPVVRADGTPIKRPNGVAGQGGVSAAGRILSLPSTRVPLDVDDSPEQQPSTTDNEQTRRVEYVQPLDSPLPNTHSMQDYSGIPLDPQIMEEVQSLVRFNPNAGSGRAFNDQLDSHNHPQLGDDEQTDYQALLDNGSAHAHQPNTTGFTSPDNGDVVMGDEESDKIMADKARDAARAALVGIDGENGGDEQSREGEMKRQLELAGFGAGGEAFARG